MTEDMRKGERRNDPNVWSPGHRKQVQTVYAMVVGGVIILFGLVIMSWAVINSEGDPNLIALGVGAGVCLIGLVASLPKTFMPILSFVLKRLPFFKTVANGELKEQATEILTLIPENDDEA